MDSQARSRRRLVLVLISALVLVAVATTVGWIVRPGAETKHPKGPPPPASPDDMVTRVYLSSLQKTEEALRKSFDRRIAEISRDPQNVQKLLDDINDAAKPSALPSVDRVHEAVLALGTALTNNLRRGETALARINALDGPAAGRVVRIVSEGTSADAQLEKEAQLKVQASGGAVNIRAMAEGNFKAGQRDRVKTEGMKKIETEVGADRLKREAIEDLIEFRIALITWRAVAEELKHAWPAPPDPVELLIETRGHYIRHEWTDAAEKARKLLDMGPENQDRDEVELMRLNALYRSGGGNLQRAQKELKDYMGRPENGISRPLHTLKGYLRLAAGDYQGARTAFSDCHEGLGTQDNESHRKILGYPHAWEYRLGEVAAFTALGQDKQARDQLGAALKEYVTAEDQSFLRRAREHAKGGQLERYLAPLRDLTSIQLIHPWVTLHWVWDDLGFTNGSAFALTDVKVSVWSEKADGSRYKDETKIADIKELLPGQESGKLTCRGLVHRSKVKRVMLRIQSSQGEHTIVAKEY